MGKHEIIDMALQLKAAERYEIVEKLCKAWTNLTLKLTVSGRMRHYTGRERVMKGA